MPPCFCKHHFDNAAFGIRLIRVFLLILVVITCTTATDSPLWGQRGSNGFQWKTGRQLDQSNQLALSVWWNEGPIGNRLASFSEHQRMGLFLDRRVDPSLQFKAGINNGTTEQFLWNVATNGKLGICRLGDFYYLGPPTMAARLPMAWEKLANESTKRSRSYDVDWKKRKSIRTESAIQPRSLLKQLASENRLKIQNLDAVPHDVWAKLQLPPTTLEGRFGIILAGFEKWFVRSADGTTIEIVDFPDVDQGRLVVEGVADARKQLKAARSKFPNLTLSAKGKTRISATGSADDIALLKQHFVNSQIPVHNANSIQTFNLNKAQASRLAIIEHIAKQTTSTLVLPSPLPDELNERVNLEKIENAELSELIELVLKGTSLTFEFESGKLTIISN